MRWKMADSFGNGGLLQIQQQQQHITNNQMTSLQQYSSGASAKNIYNEDTLPIELYRQVKSQLELQVERYSEHAQRLIEQVVNPNPISDPNSNSNPNL